MSLWYSLITADCIKANVKIVYSFGTKCLFFLKQVTFGTKRLKCPTTCAPIKPFRSWIWLRDETWNAMKLACFYLTHPRSQTRHYIPYLLWNWNTAHVLHQFWFSLRAFWTLDVSTMAWINTPPCFSIFSLKCRKKITPQRAALFFLSFFKI